MKIALVVEHCHKMGGHERYVAELAEHLSPRHEVHVFANSWEGVCGPVHFHRVPMAKKPTLLMLWSFKHNALKLIKRFGPFDVVHSQGSNSLIQNIITNHTSQKSRMAAMSSIVQSDRSLVGRLHDRIFYRYVIQAENRIYGADSRSRVIAVSQGVKKEMCKDYNLAPEKIQVIVNGVDLNRFNPAQRNELRAGWRAKQVLAQADFVLLFLGGDWERKCLGVVMEALTLTDRPEIKLAVVGKWHREPAYVELTKHLGVEKKVMFCGQTSSPEEAYSGADLFVFPSSYEACSLSVLEAMASGLPILMPRINGADEQLHEGENGLFIERSPQSVAEKIMIIAKDRQLAAAMGLCSRAMAEQYSWGNCVDQTEQFYKTAEQIIW